MWGWLLAFAFAALLLTAPGAGMMVATLMLPGALALKLDQEPGKPVARAMLTCGFAGAVRPIIAVSHHDASADIASGLLADPSVIRDAWAAAAAGWLLTQLVPLGVRLWLDSVALTRAASLRVARERIRSAWFLE